MGAKIMLPLNVNTPLEFVHGVRLKHRKFEEIIMFAISIFRFIIPGYYVANLGLKYQYYFKNPFFKI
jgi:hypothetical protein